MNVKTDIGPGGYDGQSMSNRAKAAYSEGLLPVSKLTTASLRDAGVSEAVNFVRWLIEESHLEPTEWHHTGKHHNKTDFWSPKDIAGQLQRIQLDQLREQWRQSGYVPAYSWVRLHWEEWVTVAGRGRRGHYEDRRSFGVKVGDRVFLRGATKQMGGGHIISVDAVDPDTIPADERREIMGRLPAKVREGMEK